MVLSPPVIIAVVVILIVAAALLFWARRPPPPSDPPGVTMFRPRQGFMGANGTCPADNFTGSCPDGSAPTSCQCLNCPSPSGPVPTACAAFGNKPCADGCTTICSCAGTPAPPPPPPTPQPGPGYACLSPSWGCPAGASRTCKCHACIVNPATGERQDTACAGVGNYPCAPDCLAVECTCSGGAPPPPPPPPPGPTPPPPVPEYACSTTWDCPNGGTRVCACHNCLLNPATGQRGDTVCAQPGNFPCAADCTSYDCKCQGGTVPPTPPPIPPTPGPMGPPCLSDEQCGSSGQICRIVQDNPSQGLRCQDKECNADSDCVAGKVCGAGRCYARFCTEMGDNPVYCPSGQRCDDTHYQMCIPDSCTDNMGCPQGMVCTNGQCVPFYEECRNEDLPAGVKCIKNLGVQWGCKNNDECDQFYPGQQRECVMGTCFGRTRRPTGGAGADVPSFPGSDPLCHQRDTCSLSGHSNAANHIIVVQNNTRSTFWLGYYSQAGTITLSNDGNGGGDNPMMAPGTKAYLIAAPGWSGRIWFRQGCQGSGANFRCVTGDCGGLNCGTKTGQGNVTLVEFTLDAANNAGLDTFDISVVDGMNYAVHVSPIAGTVIPKPPGAGLWCLEDDGEPHETVCLGHVLDACPDPLKVKDSSGVVQACLNARSIDVQRYGCAGPYQQPTNCIPSTWPTNYASLMAKVCPGGYNFAYSDDVATVTCGSSRTGGYSSYCVGVCEARSV